MSITTEELYISRQHDINCRFVDTNKDKQYWYCGVMCGNDDYYWVLYDKINGLQLLSCVGSIEGHGFKKVDND